MLHLVVYGSYKKQDLSHDQFIIIIIMIFETVRSQEAH